MRTITCRTHGGSFDVEPRRGRPPVRCTEDNRCTKLPVDKVAAAVKKIEAGIPRVKKLEGDPVMPASLQRPATKASEAPVAPSRALPEAMKAKERLEALGWTCKGRAWTTDPADYLVVNSRTMSGGTFKMVELVAVRDEEIITMMWADGELIDQKYSLWSTDKPANNGIPPHKLKFDPDETPDRELARHISGMKVTWWNVLANNTETAVIPKKFTIENTFDGSHDGMPGDRIIKFVDMAGSGFRAFRVGALLKVG